MRFISTVFLSLIIFSCNSKEEQPGAATAGATISEEIRLKNAIKKYPDSFLLVRNLAGLYLEAENYDAATAVIDNAISANSGNPDLWDLRSAVLVSKGDTLQAIASLEKAIDLYPLPHYIISLGALYAETKNPMALEMADALLIGNKANAEKEAFFIKGLFYSFSGQQEKALPFFDRSLSVDPRFMEAYLEKGLALYQLKKYNDAVNVLTKAVTLQNNFDRGYYYLGQCYEKLNRKADAAEAYRKALLYDPNYIEAKQALENL
ncbi:MAG: tetratricopeptide repeat protein [Ferruginibacter sp.]